MCLGFGLFLSRAENRLPVQVEAALSMQILPALAFLIRKA